MVPRESYEFLGQLLVCKVIVVWEVIVSVKVIGLGFVAWLKL